MSYDYLLVKGQPGLGVEAFVENAMSATIGTAAEVRSAISRLYPAVKWTESPDVPGATGLSSWFGSGGPAAFQLMLEPDGQVRMIVMSRCEQVEVKRVVTELGLVALDEQSLGDF